MNQRYCNGMIHVIKKGDNLYQLSRKYRIPLALILRANPYVDVYNLQVGQEICIPVARPYPSMGAPRNQNMTEAATGGNTDRMSDGNTQEARMTNDDREMLPDAGTGNNTTGNNTTGNDTAGNNIIGNGTTGNSITGDDGTEIYVSDGTRSLGGILRDYEVALSDFLEKNDLDKIIIAADVVLYLPKKV